MATAVVASGLVGVAGAAPASAAALAQWTGVVSDRWSEPGNWAGNAAPASGDDLGFMNSDARTSSVNDLPAGATFGSVYIGRAGYDLTGNAIGVSDTIIGDYASGTSSIGNDVAILSDVDLLTGGGTLALTGDVSGPGGLLVNGGRVRLAGANSYTGPTRVFDATLQVDGTVAGPVQLSGGTLSGDGRLAGSALTSSAPSTIDPGAPGTAGSLTLAATTLPSDATFHVDLDGAVPGTGHDRLVVDAAAPFDPNGAVLDLDLGFRPSTGQNFQIVTQPASSPITGRFAGLSQFASFTDGPVTYSIGYYNVGILLSVTDVAPTPTATLVVADDHLTPGESSLVTLTFNDVVSGFDLRDVDAPNATLSGLAATADPRVFTFQLTPAASTTASGNVLSLDLTRVQNAAGFSGFGTATSNPYRVATTQLVADQVPVIGGVPQVGGALTAVPGGYGVEPDDLDFAWEVDGRAVGTDSPVYRPSSADVGESVTVTVTARRAGLTDAVTVSEPTDPVAGGGLVRAWGSDFLGESNVPAALARTHTTAVAAGFNHSLALSAAGKVSAWGAGEQGTVPVHVASETVSAIAAGANHSLAVTSQGHLLGWGANGQAQAAVPSLGAAVAVAGGSNHSLALTAQGEVRAWGSNSAGQSVVPAEVDDRTAVAVAAGSDHSLALTSDGRVIAWGANGNLQSAVPDELDGETVVAIAAGRAHSLALTADGRVVAWGDNSQQQTALPSAVSSATVMAIGSGPGSDQSVALTSDRRVLVWGANPNGVRVVPAILTGEPVAAVATAGSHALALTSAVVGDGRPTIVGTPRVGDELTLDLPTFSVRPDELTVQWYDDDAEVPGADDLTFTPTLAQRGATLSASIVVERAGHRTLEADTADSGPVADGVFSSGPVADITGTPQVGATLTAETGTPVPAADSFSYAWSADGEAVNGATARTLALTPALVGAEITVTVTARRTGYVDASDESDPTTAVAKGTFTTGPTAGIEGEPVVGRSIFATVGPVSPPPNGYAYTWYADGVEITDNTSSEPQALNLTPDHAGAEITVEVTAKRDGYVDASDLSDPTAPVAKATFSPGPTAGIEGDPVVGRTIFATVDDVSPTPGGYAYAWFADGVEITDNTSPEPQALNLTAAHLGAEITVEVTVERDGYVDASDLSEPTAEVAEGTFATVPTAGITGDAVVDGALAATTGTTVPAAESFAYAWSADGDPIDGATTSTLTLTADLAGAAITVTVTAQREGYADASDESEPVTVASASFTAGPTASVSGTAQVGRTLSAGTGMPDPAPASYRYQWLADDAPIAGATGSELLLTAAHRGRRIAVVVTAVRPGYDDATDRSVSTAPVVTDRAPRVTLRVVVAPAASGGTATDGTPTVVLGRPITVRWSSEGADRLVASGALGAAFAARYPDGVPAVGRISLTLARAGLHGLRLTAVNELGATVASRAVTAVRSPARLRVTAPSTARAGGTARIAVAGLGGNERYTVLVPRQGARPAVRLAAGRAAASGRVARTVTLPDRVGQVRIRVVGRSDRRTATVVIRLR